MYCCSLKKTVRTGRGLCVALIGMLLVAGCGSNQFPVVPARGTVLCNGRPVSVGSVSFTPQGEASKLETGKPASGALREDGTFDLTTNERFDGAIVGRHSVRYVGPEGGDEDEGSESAVEGSAEERARNLERIKARQAALKNLCVQKGEIIVEVKAGGDNNFTIELSGPGGKSSP